MAPENEPTDEELAVVMREARDEAVRRHGIAKHELQVDIQRKIKERLAVCAEHFARKAKR